MPDPAAVNTGFALDSMGYVNALSSKGPKMMFNAELAVKGDTIPARALVDTGATHCYISEKFIRKTVLPIRQQHTWLSLANGSETIVTEKECLCLQCCELPAIVDVVSNELAKRTCLSTIPLLGRFSTCSLTHKVQTLNPLVTALSTMWVRLQVLNLPRSGTLLRHVRFARSLDTTSTIAGSLQH